MCGESNTDRKYGYSHRYKYLELIEKPLVRETADSDIDTCKKP